jgi:putative hydrolase of HD superfamily
MSKVINKPSFADVERVLRDIILPFYAIERAIPLRFGNRQWENDAEHSWSLAMVACMLAPHIDPRLDIGKVAQFAVVHDITEVYAGDTNVFGPEKDHQTKEEREHNALLRIQKEFAHLPWLPKILTKYEKQDTPEALYVRSIDKYIALVFDYIDEGQYYRDNKLTKARFLQHMARPRAKAKGHPGAFEYHEEALQQILSHSEFFYPDKPKATKKK